MIWVPNQLVGAPSGTNVTLECNTEAFPRAISYWVYDSMMILTTAKYQTETVETHYKTHMRLTIRNLKDKDFGRYRCLSKNSLGETEGSIRLYGKPRHSVACELCGVLPFKVIKFSRCTIKTRSVASHAEWAFLCTILQQKLSFLHHHTKVPMPIKLPLFPTHACSTSNFITTMSMLLCCPEGLFRCWQILAIFHAPVLIFISLTQLRTEKWNWYTFLLSHVHG